MTDVIERLRAANPVLDCLPPPIDDVWRRAERADLSGGESSQAAWHARGRRTRWAPGIGNAVAITLAVVTAGAVAVGVVALLGHGRITRPPAQSASSPARSMQHAEHGQLFGGETDLAARVRSLRGVPVLITVWASWCLPCREQLARSDSAATRNGVQIAFLGADVTDTASAAQAFLARNPTTFPSYQATINGLGLAVPGAGKITGLPTIIYISRGGQVVDVHPGSYKSLTALQSDISNYLNPTRPSGATTAVNVAKPQTESAPTTPACMTHNLQITPVIDGGAAGTRLLALSYRNTTTSTCNMVGFPGVTLYGRGGRKLAVARRGIHHQPIRVLQVKPGAREYGGISYSETPVPASRRCPPVTSLKIYAPNSRQASHVQLHHAGFYCAGALVRPLTTSAIASLNN